MLPCGFQYHAGYVEANESLRLRDRLWEEMNWRQYPITLFGKTHLQPRLVSWCSDHGIDYRYSGTFLKSADWHPALELLRQRLQDEWGARFNSVLVNAYRDGQDSMGWHADNEPELGPEPHIASISLGQDRRFLIRPREGGGSSRSITLENGSLLLMSGRSQTDWVHSVPKTKKAAGLRINLTFRCVQTG